MQSVKSKTKKGYVIEYAYDVNDFPFNDLYIDKVNGYSHNIATFDIETSSINKGDEHIGFMYHWQMCINGTIVFGRHWQTLIFFLNKLINFAFLSSENRMVIYVHNLSFEFQFIYNFFNFTSVFATDNHKVIKASNDFFEFRCTYMLSNMNLAKFIENAPNANHIKAEDDLDYHVIRTCETSLSELEKGYCYNDVLGLYEAVTDKLKEFTIDKIPLTSTGYVRHDCRNAMRKNKDNRKNFLKNALDFKQFELLRRTYRGGNTASNRYMTDTIIENVDSYDISSSYPFVMVAFKYPTKFIEYSIDSIDEIIKDHEHAFIGDFTFKGIKLKKEVPIPYIPSAKCHGIADPLIYNGRVLEADFLTISLTEIDLQIILKQYVYDEIYINNSYRARKDYLPDELISQLFHYFENKSKLKNIKEKYYEYMKNKNKLNSIYGMCVTSPIQNEWLFKDGEFIENTENQIEKLEKFYKSRNNFLSYQWGVYVSAYARMQLQKAIDLIGMDLVYCDTDSVKFIGDHEKQIENLNKQIFEECAKNKRIHSINIDGKIFSMGQYDKEESYDRFITLGAKKYAYEQKGKLGVTVSGLSKSKAPEALKSKGGLEVFKEGTIFNEAESGRTVAYYNNETPHFIEVNGSRFLTASNIAICDTTYTLGMTDLMKSILLSLNEY